jgi:hypothetical protein
MTKRELLKQARNALGPSADVNVSRVGDLWCAEACTASFQLGAFDAKRDRAVARLGLLLLHLDTSEWPRAERARSENESEEFPSARQVRDALGHVDIGPHRVAHDQRQDDRFPWRVLSAPDAEGFREEIDRFAQYREAIRFARKLERGART